MRKIDTSFWGDAPPFPLLGHTKGIAIGGSFCKYNTIKTMVNHVKPLLNNIILPHLFIFIHGRNIRHNILITEKMVHAMKRMKIQKVFIKIDLEKAYDKLNWMIVTRRL